MKILRILPTLVLLPFCGVNSAEIRWTASGTISGLNGTGFSDFAGIGDPVEITMVYDSATSVNPRSFFSIGAASFGEAWFFGEAGLAITVKIGGNQWRGEMPTVPEGQNVMLTRCWEGGGSPDLFKVTLDSARGGTYPEFPYGGTDSSRSLEIEFRDDQAPANLFAIHQLPGTLSCLHEMTSAWGAVRAGADSIIFTLDISTVKVSQPQVPVSIDPVTGGIRLTWETEDGKSYRLDGTADMKCWFVEGRYTGNGIPIQQILYPFAFNPQRFYRVVED